MFTFKRCGMFLAVSCGMLMAAHADSAEAPHPEIVSLMTKALSDYPGKEALMLRVEYPPGGADPIHRHDAHAFVYVLEGAVVMQVKGGPAVTLKAGETYYEAPNDIHLVGRNASKTETAKFVVLLLKKEGADALTPVKGT